MMSEASRSRSDRAHSLMNGAREEPVQIYDISLNLSAATVRWVTSPPFELHERRRISRGDPGNSSAVNMSVHSGTHLDAPFHYVPDGKTIDALPLDLFIGPALVAEVQTEDR